MSLFSHTFIIDKKISTDILEKEINQVITLHSLFLVNGNQIVIKKLTDFTTEEITTIESVISNHDGTIPSTPISINFEKNNIIRQTTSSEYYSIQEIPNIAPGFYKISYKITYQKFNRWSKFECALFDGETELEDSKFENEGDNRNDREYTQVNYSLHHVENESTISLRVKINLSGVKVKYSEILLENAK
jgi:hypothetical protein